MKQRTTVAQDRAEHAAWLLAHYGHHIEVWHADGPGRSVGQCCDCRCRAHINHRAQHGSWWPAGPLPGQEW